MGAASWAVGFLGVDWPERWELFDGAPSRALAFLLAGGLAGALTARARLSVLRAALAVVPLGAVLFLATGETIPLALAGGVAFAVLALASAWPRRVPVPLLALALLVTFGGAFQVRERVTEWVPRMELERVLLAIPKRTDLHRVVRESSEHPVRVDSVRPRPANTLSRPALPSLVLPPPSVVEVQLPATEPGAHLRLALGLSYEAYEGPRPRGVRFRVFFEGEELVDELLGAHEKVKRQERSWNELRLDGIGAGGLLRLETRLEGGKAPEGIDAGFGLLEVVSSEWRPRARASRERPNLILILADTLRADRLPAYGYPRGLTPELDALAARGTLFETAYAPSSWTWPSTASLFTALTPVEHGLTDAAKSYLADELWTLAERLQGAGWTTAAFSSNPLVAADKNFDQGFEFYTGYGWENTDVVLADALPWLQEWSGTRNFCYLHLTDPHGPYNPPEDLRQRLFEIARDSSAPRNRDEGFIRKEVLGRTSSRYDAEVASMDRELAVLFDWLEESGEAERTVVAFTSDHGEEFREHGLLGHAKQLYDESVRVPLILAGPGVPQGERVETPVAMLDLAPTLLSLLDVSPVENLMGVDLLDVEARTARAADPFFFSTELGNWEGKGPIPVFGVQAGSWRYMSSDREGSSPRLYDLSKDPKAMRDAATDNPDAIERMRTALEAWREEGERVRPAVVGGGEEAEALLRGLGYLESEQEAGDVEAGEDG